MLDFLDIEASGFGRGSYPIEVGVATSEGRCHCFLIKPARDWIHWDDSAEKVHGISRELLFTRGVSINDVTQQLNELLVGRTLYTDAWGYDSPWMMRLYDAADCWPSFKIESLLTQLTENQCNQWHNARQRAFEKLSQQRHRASVDARAAQLAYEMLHN